MEDCWVHWPPPVLKEIGKRPAIAVRRAPEDHSRRLGRCRFQIQQKVRMQRKRESIAALLRAFVDNGGNFANSAPALGNLGSFH